MSKETQLQQGNNEIGEIQSKKEFVSHAVEKQKNIELHDVDLSSTFFWVNFEKSIQVNGAAAKIQKRFLQDHDPSLSFHFSSSYEFSLEDIAPVHANKLMLFSAYEKKSYTNMYYDRFFAELDAHANARESDKSEEQKETDINKLRTKYSTLFFFEQFKSSPTDFEKYRSTIFLPVISTDGKTKAAGVFCASEKIDTMYFPVGSFSPEELKGKAAKNIIKESFNALAFYGSKTTINGWENFYESSASQLDSDISVAIQLGLQQTGVK